MAHFDRVCGYCAYMDTDTIKSGQFKCEKDGKWRFADDEVAKECYKFCEVFWSKGDQRKKAIEESKKYKSASDSKPECYITTIVVKILKGADDFIDLETLRQFRNQVLATNPKYRDLLLKYDTIGPAIARAIDTDQDKESMAEDLYICYIRPCADLIKKGDYDNAINLYKEMTESLIKKYVFNFAIGEVAEREYDQSAGGHGRYVKRQA